MRSRAAVSTDPLSPNRPPMQRKVISNIQYLRLLAASGILISHTASLLVSDEAPIWAVPWTAGVDVFFVISGFIMTWMTAGQFGEPGAWRRYLLRRISRIVPPYWFFTGLMVVATAVAGEFVRNTRFSPVGLVTSLLFIPWPRSDGMLNPLLSQGWTLNFEMFFYACFAAGLASRKGFGLILTALATLVTVHLLIPDRWFVLAYYSSPIILEFAAGMLLGQLYIGGRRLRPVAAILAVAGAVLLYPLVSASGIADPWLGSHVGLSRLLLFGFPALLLTAGVALAPEMHLGRLGELLRFGGDASYTLYLSHAFCINAVVVLGHKAGLQSNWGLFAIACASAMVFAALFYRWIEAPLTRRMNQRFAAGVRAGPTQ